MKIGRTFDMAALIFATSASLRSALLAASAERTTNAKGTSPE